MNNAPLVSVLVTVHNRAPFLPACLDSVLASTFQDFEVVIVDDSSADGSWDIICRYAEMDGRVRHMRNERNLGDYPNRMRAAGLARGRFLKYVDSDDVIYPHSLAIMVEAMVASPAARLGLEQSSSVTDAPYPLTLAPDAAWARQFLGPGCLDCGPSGAIIDRAAFEAVGGFRNWGVLNDADLWLRLSSRWPVVLLQPGLVWWRRHEGQEFAARESARTYVEVGYALALESLRSPYCPLRDDERQLAIARSKQHHARRVLSWVLRQGKPDEGFRIFRNSGLSLADLLQGLRKYS